MLQTWQNDCIYLLWLQIIHFGHMKATITYDIPLEIAARLQGSKASPLYEDLSLGYFDVLLALLITLGYLY